MVDKKKIGKSLQERRKSAGFKSAKAFAGHMGYNAKTYTGWEQGWNSLPLEQACDMADALDCTLDELVGRTPPDVSLLDSEAVEVARMYEIMNDRDKLAVMRLAKTLSSGSSLLGEAWSVA